MIINIRKIHIRNGQKKIDKCPLSLACQEAFDLDSCCINVTPMALVLKSYSGSTIFCDKWPEDIVEFQYKFYNFKKVKPCSFEIGWHYYYGDVLDRVVFNIKNSNK